MRRVVVLLVGLVISVVALYYALSGFRLGSIAISFQLTEPLILLVRAALCLSFGVLLPVSFHHVTRFYWFGQARLDVFGESWVLTFGFARHVQRDNELLLLPGRQLRVFFSPAQTFDLGIEPLFSLVL